MPIATTFPGVYIQEIPSGVRTITGVATSITAFVGRAAAGPVDEPVVVNSFADYQRVFGGLALVSPMSFAVRDFFLNGGSRAVVVRLFRPGAEVADGEARATAVVSLKPDDPDAFKIEAASPGSWANGLQMRVENEPVKNPGDEKLFRLLVRDSVSGAVEVFTALSVDPANPRFVKTVLARESQLARVSGAVPAVRPGAHPEAKPPKGVFENPANPEDEPPFSHVAPQHKAIDGEFLVADDFTAAANFEPKRGLYALRKTDLFNLLCIPPYKQDGSVDVAVIDGAAAFCKTQRALLLIDPPPDWRTAQDAGAVQSGAIGQPTSYAAVFFPRIVQPNPLRDNLLEPFVPCGAVAGVMARTDAERGVWKAPAGIDATLKGVQALSVPLSDAENGLLNPLGVNCLRSFPGVGRVVWGARTREGDDRLASEWKYVPVRRTALFIEESLFRGTKWVVFEPNDEPLWAQIRLNVGAFMQGLFRQGAFQGKTPREAYFVKCDKETTTQNDIDRGVVNILVGFAPLKPAEFVVIRLQQIAGQLEV